MQAREEQVEHALQPPRTHDSHRQNQTASTAACLYYLRHMRSCASMACGATRHSGSSAGHCINDGLIWLHAVISIVAAPFVCVRAIAFLACAVGVFVIRRLRQRVPRFMRGRQGGADPVICSAMYVLMCPETAGYTWRAMAALSTLVLKAVQIHADTFEDTFGMYLQMYLHVSANVSACICMYLTSRTRRFVSENMQSYRSRNRLNMSKKEKTIVVESNRRPGSLLRCLINQQNVRH